MDDQEIYFGKLSSQVNALLIIDIQEKNSQLKNKMRGGNL